ncbi:MAG: hypothetical protein LBM78_00820 [Clostridiales bacterium]|jgi:hypothetical protein|nr:hypothetical protein [Clostridiales bacterium]
MQYDNRNLIIPAYSDEYAQDVEELNVQIDSGRIDRGGKPIMVYKYTTLNTEIKKLDTALKHYYDADIIPQLFAYELIK